MKRIPGSLRLTFTYLLFAGIWIIFSDRLLDVMAAGLGNSSILQTYKGFLFVCVTSLLLYILLRREERIQAEAARALRDEELARSEAGQALRKAEEKYSLLFNHIRDIVILSDFQDSKTGRLIEVNDTACELLGFSRDELLRSTQVDVSPLGEREHLLEIVTGNAGQQSFEYETVLETRSGKTIPVAVAARQIEWQGKPSLLAVMRDITERRLAENALLHTSRRLQNLHEIDRSILMAQSPGEIASIALNHLKNLTGCKQVSILVIDPDTQEHVLYSMLDEGRVTHEPAGNSNNNPGLIERMRSGVPLIYPDLEMHGSPYHLILSQKAGGIRSSASFPMLAQGNLVGVLLMGVDKPQAFSVAEIEVAQEVSDQLAIAIHQSQLYEQVVSQTAVLEQRVRDRTSQLETLNNDLQNFAYSVSHDLKAPLRGIDGYSMLLMNDHSAQLDEEGLTFLKNIRRAANQMGQLIDDLLAYSRLDRRALEKSSLRLTDLISALLQEREVDLNTCNIEVVQEIECDQVYAEWDGLSQALRNLLDNSIKFLSQTPNPRIILRSEASDTACLISVRDNGIGFNMRYHDRIFDMFQRLHTQQEFPGTGIGLAVVRLAVQRMGGRVWAESIPDQGATFFLEIPK